MTVENQSGGTTNNKRKHVEETVNLVNREFAKLTIELGGSQATQCSTSVDEQNTPNSEETLCDKVTQLTIELGGSQATQCSTSVDEQNAPNSEETHCKNVNSTKGQSTKPNLTVPLAIVNPYSKKSSPDSEAACPTTNASQVSTSSETGGRLTQARSPSSSSQRIFPTSPTKPSPRTPIQNPYARNRSQRIISTSPAKQSPRTPIQNPYAKKRRLFSNQQGGSPQSLGSRQSNQATSSQSPKPLPKGLRSFDKFFTILIRNSPRRSYLDAAKDTAKANQLWELLCEIAKVKRPTQPIQACYDNADEHFQLRGALVLEETRNEISLQTDLRWELRGNMIQSKRSDPNQNKKYPWILVVCGKIDEDEGTDVTKVVVYPKGNEPDRDKSEFTTKERSDLTQGAIIECKTGFDEVYWGAINYTSEACCKMLFYGSAPPIHEGSQLWIRNMGGSHIPSFREFLACIHPQTQDVDFLDLLIGKSKQHPMQQEAPREIELVGPTLNAKQEQVVKEFLTSPSGTLQVVQGPPGCGKTTLLVSLIRNYLENRSQGRQKLMVCAPTNKAASVLATRFVSDVCPQNEEPEVGITIVGDFEKLSDGLLNQSSLRPFHLYQFRKVIMDAFRKVMNYCDPEIVNNESCDTLCQVLRRTQSRLKKRLKNLPQCIHEDVETLCVSLEKYHASTGVTLAQVRKDCEAVFKSFKENISTESAVIMDLLQSTDVFFCTLQSAGNPSLLMGTMIDDLVVDEAAAATEPALYIPLRLGPRRMLVVGDPKQLPAVVLSKKAADLGLSESLHERLMHRCGFQFKMLEEQYRMHPEIASFPACCFYDGKILNGTNVVNCTYGDNANVAMTGKPFIFFNVHGVIKQTGTNIENELEAKAVVDIVKVLSTQGKGNWDSADKLRVITFYHGQRMLISRLLKEQGFEDVLVATVDASQGCEADVVIVSFVRGGSTAGFLKDDRRINVALTRAKHQLICVGNVYGLQELQESDARTLRLLAEDAHERGMVRRRL